MARSEQAVIFLTETVPVLLQNLTLETKPLWGIMTSQHMLEHLQYVVTLSTGTKPIKVVSPWLTRRFLKLFILSQRPLLRNIKMPGQKARKLIPLKYDSLEETKVQLRQAIAAMLVYLKNSPDMRTNHPFAGSFSPKN